MKNFVKFSLLAIVAASATVASAADLEFHGYARLGFGFNSAGGNQIAFMQSVSGKSKFRLGNEADACLEPGFTMSFTKLDDKSQWGVHILPAFYRRMNGANGSGDGPFPVSYKEFYFYGQNVPQLGGGEIWAGRRYFGRNYLGAINDSFLEAQDGNGAGINDIPVGPAKLSFDLAAPGAYGDESGVTVVDKDLSVGAHVTNIPTFNKDSNLQIWARVYVPMQKKDAVDPAVTVGGTFHGKRQVGFSASVMHVSGFGPAGNLTVAGRFDQNGYTDQQDNGSGGKRNLEADVVYGVNIPSARTSIDAMVGFRSTKTVKQFSDQAATPNDTMNLILGGFRTDTQLAGPFRFLLEFGVDTNTTHKYASAAAPYFDPGADTTDLTKGRFSDGKRHTLWKITPVLAINGGNDPWSRPTFRLFWTYASWNKDGAGDVANAWKDSGFKDAFGTKQTDGSYKYKTSGSSFGIQAEGWW